MNKSAQRHKINSAVIASAIIATIAFCCADTTHANNSSNQNCLDERQLNKNTLFTAWYDVFFGTKPMLEVKVHTTLNADCINLAGEFKGNGILGAWLGGTGTVRAQNLWRGQQKRIVPIDFIQRYNNAAQRDITYLFEADRLTASARLGKEQYHFTVHPDVHSVFTMHLQLSIDAQEGKDMMYYDTLSKTKLRRYVFFNRGEERLSTALGELLTIRFDRLKKGKLDSRYWLSPQHAYLPVKVERIRNNRVRYNIQATDIRVHNRLISLGGKLGVNVN